MEDVDFRNKTLELMQVALRMYAKTKDALWMNYAKDFGKTCEMLKERIKNGDYTQRDHDIAVVEEILKR